MAGFKVERVATGLSRPVFVTAPPGDTGRLFVVEQQTAEGTGRIRVLQLAGRRLVVDPFLEVDGISVGNEQGLLGLAFHPNFGANGLFYVNLTAADNSTVVRRYKVSSADPDKADPASAVDVLTFAQPFDNHNGGWIGFGPRDGFLYVGSGDGGSEGDPDDQGQSLNTLLGKVLRIDVNKADPGLEYAIPPSNPFVNTTNARPEIWAYGLRNPWRCSFDRETCDFYIGDVGQDTWEEIDFQPAASHGGENYGWRVREGAHDSGLGGTRPPGARFTNPLQEYRHTLGILAVIGGYVYRGSKVPDLKGAYLFADFGGKVWSLPTGGSAATPTDLTETLLGDVGPDRSVSSLGEDAAGELYLVLLRGDVYRVDPAQ